MAIRLRVQDTRTTFKLKGNDTVSFTASQGVPIYPADYTGAYTVTPTQSTQVLSTNGLMMTNNVTVNPIPSNYGLITWNGAILTVS